MGAIINPGPWERGGGEEEEEKKKKEKPGSLRVSNNSDGGVRKKSARWCVTESAEGDGTSWARKRKMRRRAGG